MSAYRLFLPLSAAVLVGCAVVPPQSPEQAACLRRMEGHAAQLLPGFAALAHRPVVRLQLDDDMRDGRGFRQSGAVLGDALPDGRIRLRASGVCGDEVVARAVVAHEMAHVALQHRGMPGTGVIVEWEKPPPQEIEADRLALDVLRRTGGHPLSERFIECHLTNCTAVLPGRPARRSAGGDPRPAP